MGHPFITRHDHPIKGRMPDEIWTAVSAAKFRVDGQPDRRSPRSVEAYRAYMEWARVELSNEVWNTPRSDR